jgi:hypothetical protein
MDPGISKFNILTSQWTSYTEDDGLPSNNIKSITLEDEGIWFATDGGAAYLEKVSQSWTIVDKDDGLPTNNVYVVFLLQDTICYGTGGGFAVQNVTLDEWTIYTTSEGIAKMEAISGLELQEGCQGQIWKIRHIF